MKPGRAYTIMVQRDGAMESRTYRVPRWVLRAGSWASAALVVLVAAALVGYAPIVRSAARVPGLERQVARLKVEFNSGKRY